ncbi:MAG: hypothetical protein KJ600_01480 [Nanoarchaeota archaeon]|nr:hypothetical protein [Nanoarchaeota archaeon]MBU1103211.1 hypothetical protein [Nanoarchaeota archaeon]
MARTEITTAQQETQTKQEGLTKSWEMFERDRRWHTESPGETGDRIIYTQDYTGGSQNIMVGTRKPNDEAEITFRLSDNLTSTLRKYNLSLALNRNGIQPSHQFYPTRQEVIKNMQEYATKLNDIADSLK